MNLLLKKLRKPIILVVGFFSISFFYSCTEGLSLLEPDGISVKQQVEDRLTGGDIRTWIFNQKIIQNVLSGDVSVLDLLSQLLLSNLSDLIDQIFADKISFNKLGTYQIKDLANNVIEQGTWVVNDAGNVLTLTPEGNNAVQVLNIDLLSDTELKLSGKREHLVNIDIDPQIETVLIDVELDLDIEL